MEREDRGESVRSVKAEHVSGDSIDAVDSVRAPTGEDHGADSDPLHYLQNPSQNPCPFDANAGTGGSQSVTGYESFDYDTKSFCGTLVEDIIISLDIHSRDAEMITQRKFRDVILHQKIPVTTCLVAFMGLPCTGKTTAIERMLKEFIKLKEKSTFSFDDYMERKRNDECLSIYELCVLGGLPHDKYAWSFATNRYGAINSIICSLARQYPSITEAVFESTKKKSESFVDKHVQWLMEEVSNHLGKIKGESRKLTLIQDGISLINVMDVGVNKAIYDFLSIMLLSCKRHFRVAFFSMDRDAPNLNKVPDLSHSRYDKCNDGKIVMRERSRLSYLLHFGTLGYKKDDPGAIDACNTVMVATKEGTTCSDAVTVPEEDSVKEAKQAILEEAEKEGVDQFLKEWELVNLMDAGTLRNLGETLQDIIKKVDQYKLELPLRWIILRSLVSSLNPQSAHQPNSKAIIMSKDFIMRQATHLNMNQKDVEDFLVAFTEFGNILYMPQFEDIKHLVIVDIYGFTELLHKLFYPPNPEAPYAKRLLKYGIISLQSIQALLGSDVVNSLMQILTSFVMVAKIKSKESILIDDASLDPGVYYYLPSAKSGANYTPSESDDKCAFLEVASVNFPANFQACISQGVMKENDVFLCSIEYSNISQFEFKSKDGAPGVRIDLIYEGQKSRLVVRHDINASTFDSIVDACTKVLDAFCHCLGRKANTIRDLKHEVTIPCDLKKDKRHTLYCNKELEKCSCLEAIDQNSFRSCWVEAAKKCRELKHSADKEAEKGDPIESTTIFEIGEWLEKSDNNVSRLAEVLQTEAPPDLRDKKKAAMIMLLAWEERCGSASLLDEKLKKIGMPRSHK